MRNNKIRIAVTVTSELEGFAGNRAFEFKDSHD